MKGRIVKPIMDQNQRPSANQSTDLQSKDELVDELLATNARFRHLVAQSKASPRKPFGSVEEPIPERP